MSDGNHEDDRADSGADQPGQAELAQAELDTETARVRDMILARRSRFVAAALAGVGLGGACATAASSTHDTDRVALDATGSNRSSGGAAHDGGPSASDSSGSPPDAGSPQQPPAIVAPGPCLTMSLD